MPRSIRTGPVLAAALLAAALGPRHGGPQDGPDGVPRDAPQDEWVAGPPGPTTPAPYPSPHTVRSLFFVTDATVRTADEGRVEPGGLVGDWPDAARADGLASTVLGLLFDTNVARFTPGVDPSARKVHATPEVVAATGDLDGDGDLWEVHWEDIDALGVRRLPWHPERVRLADLVVSTRHDWGEPDPWSVHDQPGALDGDLFSLVRSEDGAGFRARRFLGEATLMEALGQAGDPLSDGVDVDAFAQGPEGDLFLSFREDEWVAGELLGSGGVAHLPRGALAYRHGDVADAAPHSARVALSAAGVDALVANAELKRPSGWPVTTLGNLQALEIDPAGGAFPAADGGAPLPHLLFAGEKGGPTVLTTRDGGRIADLDGRSLGASPMDGAALGLHGDVDAPGHDLGGLLVMPRPDAQMCLDLSSGQVDLALEPRLEFVLGGATPGGVIALLLTLGTPGGGAQLASQAAPAGWVHPDLYVGAPAALLAGRADGRGRLAAGLDLPPSIAGPLWVVAQAFDTVRQELSPPAAVWAPG